MKSWEKPTADEVSRAIALLAQPAHRRFFFERLENPEWVEPLFNRGVFKSPPNEDKPGPAWAESRYLARVAGLKPKEVAAAIQGMEDTTNRWVIEDLIHALTEMPAKNAFELLQKTISWALSDRIGYLSEQLVVLAVKFAEEGRKREALALTKAVLEPQQNPRLAQLSEDSEERFIMSSARPRFDLSHYEEILKSSVPRLIGATGFAGFHLMCDLLDQALSLEPRREKDPRPWDFSYIWRPAIEDVRQNSLPDLKSSLVSAVRDAAEILCLEDSSHVPKIVNILEQRAEKSWIVFRRVALYILKRYPKTASELVTAYLTGVEYINNIHLLHEYSLLLEQEFANLKDSDKQKVLVLILTGPADVDIIKSNWKNFTGADVTEERIDQFVKSWRRDRLDWIHKDLEPQYRETFESLVKEVGKPEHSQFASYMTEVAGEASPKATEDFRSMSIDAIVAFLREWTPSGGFMEPTRGGASNALSTVASEQPERFANEAVKFIGLPAPYVRAILSGLEQAVRAKRSFSWNAPIELCLWAAQQTSSPSDVKLDPFDDPGWESAHSAAADLLMEGLKQDPSYIDPSLRQTTWRILEILAEHPDPSVEDEERYSGSMDPQTMSLNTVRGKAMHAIVAYAWWVYKRLPPSEASKGFESLPEVRRMLESHLDPEREPSLAVRSVYGQWFPRLFAIDRRWCTDQAQVIFPSSDTHVKFWEAAWAAYLASWGVYTEIFQTLNAQYEHAVEILERPAQLDRVLADPKAQLSAHLIGLFWSDRLSIDDELLVKFWLKAPPDIRGSALETIGRWLHAKNQQFTADLLDRLMALWNSRLAAARENQNTTERSMEMEAFKLWFGSGQFGDDWAIARLLESLELVDPSRTKGHGIREEVVTRLVKIADRFSLEVVKALGMLIGADKFGWDVRVYEQQFTLILSAALKQQGEAAKIAERIINDLWSGGYRQYGALLGAPV